MRDDIKDRMYNTIGATSVVIENLNYLSRNGKRATSVVIDMLIKNHMRDVGSDRRIKSLSRSGKHATILKLECITP